MRDTLIAIFQTLNQITVQGRGNLDRLLGCIQALERLIEQIPEQSEEKGEEDG